MITTEATNVAFILLALSLLAAIALAFYAHKQKGEKEFLLRRVSAVRPWTIVDNEKYTIPVTTELFVRQDNSLVNVGTIFDHLEEFFPNATLEEIVEDYFHGEINSPRPCITVELTSINRFNDKTNILSAAGTRYIISRNVEDFPSEVTIQLH